MPSPNDRKYTRSHEWVKIDGNQATVGLTEYAIQAIKDIVYVELPQPGAAVEALKPFGVVESVKAVFDIYAPVSGLVVEVNAAVQESFEALAGDPFGQGWLIKLQVQSPDLSHLLDAAAYDQHCASEPH